MSSFPDNTIIIYISLKKRGSSNLSLFFYNILISKFLIVADGFYLINISITIFSVLESLRKINI